MRKRKNSQMEAAEYTGPERRKCLRLPSHCALQYTKLSKNLRPLIDPITKSHMENVCAVGIKFIGRKKIPVRTIIEFRFKIPDTNRSIAGLGEVTRSKPRTGRESYNVGLKFLWIQRKNANLIDTYVQKKRIQQIVKKLRKK